MSIHFPQDNDRINRRAQETKEKLLQMKKIAQELFGITFTNPFPITQINERESIRELDENTMLYKKFKKNKERVFIDFHKQNQYYMLDNDSFKTLKQIQSQKQLSEDRIETSCQSYKSLVNRSIKSVLSQRFDKEKTSSQNSPKTTYLKNRSSTWRKKTINLNKQKATNNKKSEYETLLTQQKKLLKSAQLQRQNKEKLQQDFQNIIDELNNVKQSKELTLQEKYKKKYFF